MAGYGLKSFLIAQSLNQIEKAYGANNAILDNCHVRVSFATNDERTAKRVSDALGTATEMRAMKNYAGHRLSPWLGHLMVSRQETARPLLTPGEVMQLPSDDELVLVSGVPPIRGKKARYFADPRLVDRVLAPPNPVLTDPDGGAAADDWSRLPPIARTIAAKEQGRPPALNAAGDAANAGIRREPELPGHEDIVPEPARPAQEFNFEDREVDAETVRNSVLREQLRGLPRQAALDPDDGLGL